MKKRYRFWIACAILMGIQLLFSLRFMGRQYFSLDEVSQIGFIAKKNSWGQIINYYLTSEVTNLPFWPLIAAVWYRVVPYGEGWMRLLTVIFTTASIIMLIKSGKSFGGEKTGLMTAVLACISPIVMQKCGLTFRVHAFWLFFTALVFYLYIERNKREENKTRDYLVLGLAMAGLAYSHYFGCLTIVYLFITDLVRFIGKKIDIKFMISYLIGGGSLVPWFILMLSRRTMNLDEFWPKVPTFASIPKALRYIVGYDEPLFVLLIITMIVTGLKLILNIVEKKEIFGKDYYSAAFAFMSLIFVVADYIYSAHINLHSGIFVTRYFISCVTAATIVIADFISTVLDKVQEFVKSSMVIIYGTTILFILFYIGAPNYYYDVKEEVSAPYDNTYGNVRDTIIADDRLYDENTMIAINANRANADGFEEYYLEYGGSGADVHVVSNEDQDIKDRIDAAEYVYVYQVMTGTPDVYTDIMGDDFEEVWFDKDVRLYLFKRK